MKKIICLLLVLVILVGCSEDTNNSASQRTLDNAISDSNNMPFPEMEIGEEIALTEGELFDILNKVWSDADISVKKITKDYHSLYAEIRYTEEITDDSSKENTVVKIIEDYKCIFDNPQFMEGIYGTTLSFVINEELIFHMSNTKQEIGGITFNDISDIDISNCSDDEGWTRVLAVSFSDISNDIYEYIAKSIPPK